MLLLDITSWWNSLGGMQQVYWSFAVPFSLIFILQTLITFISGDGDASTGHADELVEGDDGMGFHFFTLKNMVAFFTIFGWVGLACIEGGLGNFITIFISVFAGLVMMFIMASIFYFMSKLAYSGTLKMKNALHQIGEVYLTIPSSRKGFGKIQITVQGSVHELDAMTDDEEDLKNGTLIKVIEIINNQILLVTKNTK
ncbi:MAG: hypothetical protein HUU48_05190 [Flavobacteriales bacterium]|nr:hypothetical protein [Flavobacteriales bacterium]